MLLIVDGSHVLYRTLFARDLSTLSAASGLATGGIYGTLRVVRKLIYDLHPHACVVVFDGSHSERRRELHPHYKGGKSKEIDDPEKLRIRELYSQQSVLAISTLRSLAISVLKIDNMEGDDVIYQIADASPHYNVIAAEDKDFLQLVDFRTNVYQPMKDQEVNVTNFNEVVGVDIDRYLLHRALVGDPSDNIKGVPGIGDKRATEALQKVADVDSLIEWSKKQTRKVFHSISEYRALIERNLQLMDLSLEPIEDENLMHILEVLSSPVQINRQKLEKGFSFLGFHSLLDNMGIWTAPFDTLNTAF